MAAQHSKAVRERWEKIETDERHWATVHTGAREMLIAAGLARTTQFPGEPGCGKTSTVFPADGAGRKMQVRRRSTYLYEVAIYKTKEEREAYDAAQRIRWQEEEEESAAVRAAAEQGRRERLREETQARSPDGYRRHILKVGKMLLYHVHTMLERGNDVGPFHYTNEAIEECKASMADLVAALESGDIRATRERVNPKNLVATASAQADALFQRFMQQVQQATGGRQ